jgi:hypothetical protein
MSRGISHTLRVCTVLVPGEGAQLAGGGRLSMPPIANENPLAY